MSNNIYLGILHIFLTHIVANIVLILKLFDLAAILNMKYVPSLKVSEICFLGPITCF